MLTSVKTRVITTFPAGVRLRLGDAHVIHRTAQLRSVGKGLYDTLDPVQFKAGEIVGVDVKLLPKCLRDGLEPVQFKAGEIVGVDVKLLPKCLRDGLEPIKEPA